MHLIILSVQLCIDVQDDTEFKILGGTPGCNAQIHTATTTVEAGTVPVTFRGSGNVKVWTQLPQDCSYNTTTVQATDWLAHTHVHIRPHANV